MPWVVAVDVSWLMESKALVELRRLALADFHVRSCGWRYCGCSLELYFRGKRCPSKEQILGAAVVKLTEWTAKAMSWQLPVLIEQGDLCGLALVHFGDQPQHWRN